MSKKETVIGPHSKVGLDSTCPFCGKIFSKSTTYHELNSHKDLCFVESRKPKVKDHHVEDSDNILALGEMNINSRINYNFDNTGNQISHRSIGTLKKMNNSKSLKSNNPYKQYKSQNNQNPNEFYIAGNSQFHNDKSEDLFNDIFNRFKPRNVVKPIRNSLNNKFSFESLLPVEKIKPHKKTSCNNNGGISNLNLEYLKDFPFDEKIEQFKKHLQTIKVDWSDGFCNLQLDREKLLSQSIEQFNKIDPYKELHINFKGEVSHDAGGIIREWFTVIFKELQQDTLSK